MLIKRIVTAGILMPLVIGGVIYLPPMIFDLLALLIILLAVWEFSGLFKWLYKKRVIFTGAIGLIILFMEFIYLTYMVGGEFVYFISRIILILLLPSILLIGVLWWLITPYFLWCYIKRGYKGFVKPEILGSIMFTSCWVSLFVLRSSGSLPICLLLFLIWAADIGAYFVGRFFGKHPLAPKISPKKTIEGVGGGVLTSLVVAIVFIVWQTSTTELNKIKIISFLIL